MDMRTKIIVIMMCLSLAIASLSIMRSIKRLVRNNENEPVETIEKQLKMYISFAAAIMVALVGLTIFVFMKMR